MTRREQVHKRVDELRTVLDIYEIEILHGPEENLNHWEELLCALVAVTQRKWEH